MTEATPSTVAPTVLLVHGAVADGTDHILKALRAVGCASARAAQPGCPGLRAEPSGLRYPKRPLT
jgi:hypothetical protein